MKPRLLDLFCGAGGAGMGYHQAGFDVTGVDIAPQPHYPFAFIQGDALEYLAEYGREYDVIHASPPCQAYSIGAARWHKSWPDLLAPTREALDTTGRPYVIENVDRAPFVDRMILCGTMFGLKVLRHRGFESNIMLLSSGKCVHQGTIKHDRNYVTVAGHGGHGSNSFPVWKQAMQIDWMTKEELAQAIPPAYTKFIGEQLIRAL